MYKHLIRREPGQISPYGNVAGTLLTVGEFDQAAAYGGLFLRKFDDETLGVASGQWTREVFEQSVNVAVNVVDQLRRRKEKAAVPLAAAMDSRARGIMAAARYTWQSGGPERESWTG